MGILDGLFGGGNKNNPMDAANEYLDQIPGVAHEGYDSYIDAGKDASGKTKDTYESLMNDPQAFISKLMENYQESDAYKYQSDKLGKQMGNTAAAGGIAGTPLDQMNQAEGIQGLMSKDMQQYLQNALGVFNTGLSGEEGVATRGYDASGKLTDAVGGALNQQGGLAFQDAQQKNKNKGDMWSMFGKALGAGVGGLTGGIPGATIGANLF